MDNVEAALRLPTNEPSFFIVVDETQSQMPQPSLKAIVIEEVVEATDAVF